MSDRNAAGQLRLDQALRALPLQAPAHGVWSQLAQELAPVRAVRHRRRFMLPAALAAGIAIAIATTYVWNARQFTGGAHAPLATTTSGAASTETGNAAASNPLGAINPIQATDEIPVRLAALQKRSRDLENWLQDTAGSAAPLPGQDLAAAAEIENLIGLVDVQLAAPEQHDDANLWNRRVDLLEDLTALRYSNYRLAEASAGSRTN
jgi:hypothetical protein